jgi:hypothetical protein
MPLSFYYEKLNEDILYNYHLLNDEDFKKLGQLKQKRSGYITNDLDYVNIDYSYSQKSSYDYDLRRSKDSAMFGFDAIKKDTEWMFKVSINEDISEEEISLIKNSLIGIRQIGKSKSAQYGLVEINEISNKEDNIENLQHNKEETYLYVNSRLALFDENGYPTFDVKYICPNLNVNYSKTQIKTISFVPYNTKRATKDYERVCIEKGSVIVVNNITSEQIDIIKNGVGAYLSEGFGDILINPAFLQKKKFNLNKTQKASKTIKLEKIEQEFQDNTIQFLVNKQNDKIEQFELMERVFKFIDDNKALYKNIKNSQWGRIRNICNSNDSNKMNLIRDYLESGIKRWDSKQISTLLNNNDIEFIRLVSIQMHSSGGK